MYLLVMILDNSTDLERILEKFKDIGITGATIFDSVGMGRTTLYGTDAPIIASLKRIFERQAVYNHTVISIIKSEKTLVDAIELAKSVCGDFQKPDKGIIFTLKLDQVIGFSESPDV